MEKNETSQQNAGSKADKKKLIACFSILAVLAITGFLLYWNAPERQVRRAFSKMTRAVKERRIEPFMLCLSPSFSSDSGMGRDDVGRMTGELFSRSESILIQIKELTVEVKERDAVVTPKGWMAIKLKDMGAVKLDDKTFPTRIIYKKGQEGWKIVDIQIEGFDLSSLLENPDSNEDPF